MALSSNRTKSSHSDEQIEACVEARLYPHGVQVRDSKDASPTA
ncbi:DUF397 domain-containing protein [Streptomyces sp. NPDC005438]